MSGFLAVSPQTFNITCGVGELLVMEKFIFAKVVKNFDTKLAYLSSKILKYKLIDKNCSLICLTDAILDQGLMRIGNLSVSDCEYSNLVA